MALRVAFIGAEAIKVFLRRGDVRALFAAVSLSELVDFIQGEEDKSLVALIPQFALVDMKTQTIIKTLSKRKVYAMLTRPSRRRIPSRSTVHHLHHDEHHDIHH